MRRVGSLLAVVLAIGCLGFGDRTEFWRHDGAAYSIDDVPANRTRGNISRIVLYWVRADSRAMRKDEVKVWEVKPQKPTRFAGFKFRALETPSGFTSTKKARSLPASGYYYLEIYGFPESSILMSDLPRCDTVVHWRQQDG